jgi:C-terminal processing protease CtpA/Prc
LALAGFPGAARAESKPTQMEKFVVNEKHLLCFGLALSLWENKNSGYVLAMYVKDVAPGSMAEQKGLRPGSRIWAIDGVPVTGFAATFSVGSELGRKFVDRKRGDVIVLEATPQGEARSRFISLTQSPLTVTVR